MQLTRHAVHHARPVAPKVLAFNGGQWQRHGPSLPPDFVRTVFVNLPLNVRFFDHDLIRADDMRCAARSVKIITNSSRRICRSGICEPRRRRTSEIH
jgi:hypothetical protein